MSASSGEDRAGRPTAQAPAGLGDAATIPDAGALLALAGRCEQAAGDDATALVYLEMDICSALGIEPEGHERPFVTSLAAAMTLKVDGRVILNIAEDDITTAIVAGTEATADTPPLALCAAALRARAAQ